MGRKRNTAYPPSETPMASSSSANFYRHAPLSALHRDGHQGFPRSESPPASAYFPLLSANANSSLRPTPGAHEHFAYSTQLRRHQSEAAAALQSPAVFAAAVNAEATSLWRRAVNWVTGQQSHEYQAVGPEPPEAPKEDRRDTPSAHFAHVSVEVGLVDSNMGPLANPV